MKNIIISPTVTKLIFLGIFYFMLILLYKSIDQSKVVEPVLTFIETDNPFDKFDASVKYWADKQIYNLSKVKPDDLYFYGFSSIVILIFFVELIVGMRRLSPLFKKRNINARKQIK